MSGRSLAHGAACILFVLAAHVPTAAQTPQPVSGARLIEHLKVGGYNLYIRHAATVWSQSDKITAYGDWVSCDPDKVRQLSEAGRKDARKIGLALRALGVRLGRVFASPYCRTMQTAQLVSQRKVTPTIDLMNLRSEDFVGGRAAVVARARMRLSGAPEAGVNDLFAAHGNLGRAAIGQMLGEGEILVLKPGGDGKFHSVGTLTLSDLKALVGR